MNRVVLIGANSAIMVEVARILAAEKAALCLVGRNREKLDLLAQDLGVRGASTVQTFEFDATAPAEHEALVNRILSSFGDVTAVVIGHGSLPDQAACAQSFQKTRSEFDVNCLSPIAFATAFANYFEGRKQGQIVVIGSVAGDRGRQSNYVYGAAKGALDLFLGGLRNRLAASNVDVITIKPGFVDTPMTSHIKKGPLFASAEKVAGDIRKAMKKRRNVVYTPWFWFFIMAIIRNIPEAMFKKMKL